MTVTVPLPPSLNHAYITTKQGKRIMTSECRDYKTYTTLLIKSTTGLKMPYSKLKSIHYTFYLPDNRKRDIPDNAGKILRDCIKGVIVDDDCWQCIDIETFGPHFIDKDNPRVIITYEV